MSSVAPDRVEDGASASPATAPPRGIAEHWCLWCHAVHGFGYCAHASWLTHDALARRGAHFNWR